MNIGDSKTCIEVWFPNRQPPPLHHATVVIATYTANTVSKNGKMTAEA